MALTQMPGKITAFFLSISSNKNVILFLINVCSGARLPRRHGAVVLIWHADPASVMVNFGVTGPFRHDHDAQSRHRPVPPAVGSILFVGCAVGKVTIEQVMRASAVSNGVMFAVLMLVTYVSEISLGFRGGCCSDRSPRPDRATANFRSRHPGPAPQAGGEVDPGYAFAHPATRHLRTRRPSLASSTCAAILVLPARRFVAPLSSFSSFRRASRNS